MTKIKKNVKNVFFTSMPRTAPSCLSQLVGVDDLPCRRSPRSTRSTSWERKCADTIGTVLVPRVGRFQC